jgi:hypothetical protein
MKRIDKVGYIPASSAWVGCGPAVKTFAGVRVKSEMELFVLVWFSRARICAGNKMKSGLIFLNGEESEPPMRLFGLGTLRKRGEWKNRLSLSWFNMQARVEQCIHAIAEREDGPGKSDDYEE